MGDRRRKPIPEEIQRRITKIFVTNLPERCSGTDLASRVRDYGQIFDLYIARKRDNRGNRFGFVSMLDVKDKEELLKSIRNIRMGDYRLWCNVARFVLEDSEINNNNREKGNTSNETKHNQHAGENLREGKFSIFRDGKHSFKEKLVGIQKDESSYKSVRIDNNVNDLNGVNGRALVARMIDLDALKNIEIILNDICPSLGRVQYFGLDVLITLDDAETALAVRDAARSILGRFSKISIWEGQTFGFERLAWLKIKGIPLHLLSNEVINAVGGVFGKVVHGANRAESDRDLSFEYVGVLVGDGKRVSEEVTLLWKDQKFKVWVMEELGEWIPDFIDVKSKPDQSNTDDSDREPEKTHDDKHGDLNGNKDDVGMTMDASELETSERFNGEVFVPAINFPFEQFLGVNNGSQTGVNKVNKRKKFKSGCVLGRPSNAYSSSQESLKVVKRTKPSDPFGLDALLGLNQENNNSSVEDKPIGQESEGDTVDAQMGVSNGLDSGEANIDTEGTRDKVDEDLNPSVAISAHQQEDQAPGDEQPSKEDTKTSKENFNREVEQTMRLGLLLGAQLQNQRKLVQESFEGEGLQVTRK